MKVIWILSVIFTFVVVLFAIAQSEYTKKQKMKMERDLRDEEIKRGYTPGSFSENIDEKVEDIYQTLSKGKEKLEEVFIGFKNKVRK